MFCHPYHHQTCHPALSDPFENLFDEMMFLTARPSTCHSAHLKAQKAMEAKRREQAARQQAARQQQALRAKLLKRERAKPLQVRLLEDDDDALVVSLRVTGQRTEHSQLQIDENGSNSLRVSMVALRPTYQRVQDFWGHQRLVQRGVEKQTLFSQTLNFKTDVPLVTKDVQAHSVSHDTVLLRIPYVRQEVDAEEDVEEEVDAAEFEVTIDALRADERQKEAEQQAMRQETCAQATAAPEASEESFEIPVGTDDADDADNADMADDNVDNVSGFEVTMEDMRAETQGQGAEQEAATAATASVASEDSFEIPIDGSIEDCDLDA